MCCARLPCRVQVDAIAGSRSDSEHEASRRVKTELMTQMDGAGSSGVNDGGGDGDGGGGGGGGGGAGHGTVIVLAATNRPWDLDEALRRRLEKRVYIPLPTSEGRRELFRINMKGVALGADVDLEALAAGCADYSGADIACVCRDASMMSMRRLMGAARQRARDAKEKDEGSSNGGGGSFLAGMKGELLSKLGSLEEAAVGMDDFVAALAKVNKSVGAADLEKYRSWMAEFGSA